MPATLVSFTNRFIVYEIPNGETTLRMEISGRSLGIDPVTGRITGGTINRITNTEYAGDVASGAGRSWTNLSISAGDLSTTLNNADWHEPQANTLAFYTAMAALPATTLVTTFTSTTSFIQGTDLVERLRGTLNSDTIMGGGGSDRLYGLAGDDLIHGDAGDDRVYGEDGDDVLYGDVGNDRLFGGSGSSWLFGGEGNDALTAGDDGAIMEGGAGDDGLGSGAGADDQRGGDGNDGLVGGAGNDTQFGDAGDDRMLGGLDDDAMYGGAGADNMNGNAGLDHLEGGDGDDKLDGREDDDVLFGGAGNDLLLGSDGADVIYMETGNDTAAGGLGDDQFIFDAATTGSKVIGGFTGAEDIVIFNQFDGDSPTAYQYFLEHAVNVGRDVVFTDGDLTITFTRTQLSAFSLDNFGVADAGGGGGGGGGDIIG